jgi:hypothetical protein
MPHLIETILTLYPDRPHFRRVPVESARYIHDAQPEPWEVTLACGHILLGIADADFEERMRCYRCEQEGRLP